MFRRFSSSERFLVVDPDSSFRATIERALKQCGCRVATASTCDEALAVFNGEPYTRALVAVDVPDWAGIHLIERLTDLSESLIVIAVTAYPNSLLVRDAILAGAGDCIPRSSPPAHIAFALANARNPLLANPEVLATPTLEQVTTDHIYRVLHEHKGNITRAARALGLHRQSLQRMLKKIRPDPRLAMGTGSVPCATEPVTPPPSEPASGPEGVRLEESAVPHPADLARQESQADGDGDGATARGRRTKS